MFAYVCDVLCAFLRDESKSGNGTLYNDLDKIARISRALVRATLLILDARIFPTGGNFP